MMSFCMYLESWNNKGIACVKVLPEIQGILAGIYMYSLSANITKIFCRRKGKRNGIFPIYDRYQ